MTISTVRQVSIPAADDYVVRVIPRRDLGADEQGAQLIAIQSVVIAPDELYAGSPEQTVTGALADLYESGGGGAGADKWAYLAVGSFASVAAARTACTACLTTAPKNVSGFTDSWDLIADGNSDMGGVNLAAAGTGGTFDSDDPLAGGGGAVIISSCFMRSETPWRQVRQLGLRRTTP